MLYKIQLTQILILFLSCEHHQYNFNSVYKNKLRKMQQSASCYMKALGHTTLLIRGRQRASGYQRIFATLQPRHALFSCPESAS